MISLGAPAPGAARASTGQLQITYVGSSSFRIAVNGNSVPAGGTIPADSYDVFVDDPDDTNPHFQLSGPGVNVDSNLNSTGMGIDRPATFGPFTFSAGATYTARDVNSGASISFGVGAGSSSGSTTTTSSGGTPSPTTTTSSGSKTTTVGTLRGSISASGKAALTFGGKTVKRLKAGIYTLTVTDRSKKAGLVVQKLGFPAMTESSRAFVGSHSSRLTLSTGKWFFRASSGGLKTYFTVTG